MVGRAITTEERFEDFTESLCHLFDDGIIRRYGKKIGSFSDIEILNVIDADCLDAAEQSLHQTGLTPRQKETIRQMIQSALDTGSA